MALDLFLQQAVVVLGAAVVVLLVSHRLRVPPLAGLLLTGLMIGPSGAGLVSDGETIHMLAEIGVVLLLFVIGLELSLGRLKEVRRPFLIGGSIQAVLTTGIGMAAAILLGWRPGQSRCRKPSTGRRRWTVWGRFVDLRISFDWPGPQSIRIPHDQLKCTEDFGPRVDHSRVSIPGR